MNDLDRDFASARIKGRPEFDFAGLTMCANYRAFDKDYSKSSFI